MLITEPLLDEKYKNNGEFLRTFFLEKRKNMKVINNLL